ncbi:hypothetical protein [Streptomyces sp. H51]|uniref:hypothetical protein n=1 Tax=Streptomyces sp. H51 TaxID=3111770 RepID=UPI002D7682EF|nr:hypothetical protein [Streptomyces sp. H51]
MVGSSHEAMHRIFQDHPRLFSRVSDVLGIDFTPPTSVTILPTDVTEAAHPLERRADILLRLETEHDEPLLLAVEAQGSKDPDKPASWAHYASYLLMKYRLQPMLLVLCQDPAIVAWAARPVVFGHPQSPLLTLHPLVTGPRSMPVLTDPAEVREDLALAALSAITHAANPAIETMLKAMTAALRDEPAALANPIVGLVAQGLGENPAADIWRKLVAVDLSFCKLPLPREIREEGRVEGQAQRAAWDVLEVLEVRGIHVPGAVRERVIGCDDLETLRRWHRRAVITTTAEDIFTER